MRWPTAHNPPHADITFTAQGLKPTAPMLFGRLRQKLLLHVLPLLLMLLITGWLTLKAGAYIDQSKQLPSYATLDDR